MNNNRAKLLLLNAQKQIIKEFEINNQPDIIIGRSPESNIFIESTEISRSHAKILIKSSGFFLTDLKSTNGTFLNGNLLENEELLQLKSNDRINLGEISLVFQVLTNINQNSQNLNNINNQQNSQNINNINTEKPIYLPPAPNISQNQDFIPSQFMNQFNTNNNYALSDEEKKLAEELFGDTKKQTQKNKPLENSLNLFGRKANTDLNILNTSKNLKEFNENDLFNQVLGSTTTTTYNTENNVINQQINTETATMNNYLNLITQEQSLQTNNNFQINKQILNETFYYPEAKNSNPENFLPQNPSQTDPSDALTFKENDSILSNISNISNLKGSAKELFNEKLKLVKNEDKPSIQTTLKNYALPIGIIIVVVIIAVIFGASHRPAFSG